MIRIKDETKNLAQQDNLKSFFDQKETDCILYSEEGIESKIHKEILQVAQKSPEGRSGIWVQTSSSSSNNNSSRHRTRAQEYATEQASDFRNQGNLKASRSS